MTYVECFKMRENTGFGFFNHCPPQQQGNLVNQPANRGDLLLSSMSNSISSSTSPPIDPESERLPPEIEEGNIEYKRRIDPSPERLEELVSQLKWRLSFTGEAWYEIGVSDSGLVLGLEWEELAISLQTLSKMCEKADATILSIRQQHVKRLHTDHKLNREDRMPTLAEMRRMNNQHEGVVVNIQENENNNKLEGGVKTVTLGMAEVWVCQILKDQRFEETRISVLGDTRTGKSTLIGSLCHGVLDDGRGKARINLLRHRHEILTGRTSSISSSVIGFDAQGNILNTNPLGGGDTGKRPMDWSSSSNHQNLSMIQQELWPVYQSSSDDAWNEIIRDASKVVSLFDMAGHEKYLKTTISGLVRHSPDYACLVVSSICDVLSEITKEHFIMASALNVPVFITITKMDISNPRQLQKVINQIRSFLNSQGRQVLLVSNLELIEKGTTSGFFSKGVVPILALSSVTWKGFDLFKKFLFNLPKRDQTSSNAISSNVNNSNSNGSNNGSNNCIHSFKSPATPSLVEFHVEDVFEVQDVGTVLSGSLVNGTIKLADRMHYYLGPDKRGNYRRVRIRSIHRTRTPVPLINHGQSATLALFDIDRKFVRAGMVLFGDRQHHQRSTGSILTRSNEASISPLDLSFPNCGAYFELEARITVISAQKPIYPKQNGTLLVGCVRQTVLLKQICQVLGNHEESTSNSIPDPTRSNSPKVGNNFSCSTSSSSDDDQSYRNHCGSLKKSDEAVVIFRFLVRPEYVKNGAKLVYRNGKTKMVGRVEALGRGYEAEIREDNSNSNT